MRITTWHILKELVDREFKAYEDPTALGLNVIVKESPPVKVIHNILTTTFGVDHKPTIAVQMLERRRVRVTILPEPWHTKIGSTTVADEGWYYFLLRNNVVQRMNTSRFRGRIGIHSATREMVYHPMKSNGSTIRDTTIFTAKFDPDNYPFIKVVEVGGE